MLSRIGGGNSGIVYYLETGQKQGRELGRDDLDYRLCLDGNIEQLDHIIDSIPDKGQERYLHISLSFHENQVNEETLKAVCEEYKTLLMNAYDKDEYCFYAEAHIPKVKNVVDEKTGLLIERKPHIHIVIPEKNLMTGNKLLPTGKVTLNIDKFDTIQEHINNKFNLASPKDGIRVSDQNHANVLSRMKGDLFNEAKSDFKNVLISDIEKLNIKTEKEFLNHLSKQGEVKIYNQGKTNQYYGVKLPDESKFTRLKNPLFSKQFIETRTIPLIKPTPKQIEKDLSEWCNKTSHEIKHIHPAGEKLRKTYAKLNDNDKADMLLTLRNQYNERHKIERESRENIHGQLQRGRNSQRSFTPHSKRTQSRSTPQRLSSLQERNMVYELRGYGQRTTQQSNPILPSNERGSIKNEQSGQYHRGGMRRASDSGRARGRITNPIQQSLIKLENKPSQNDLTLMREIRQTINPERFLSYCVSKYNIDPALHKVTFAKDNSPRFAVGKLNLNASDFLTKHLGLSWEDAKIDLLTINESQQKNEPFLSVLSRTPLNREEAKERTLSRESAKKTLTVFYRDEKKALEFEYRQELKMLFSIKNIQKKEVERGFLMFNHLKDIETLNKITQEKRSVVNAIHNHWNPNDVEQKILLNKMLTERGIYMTNKIMNADADFSFEKTVARKKQFNEFEEQVQNGKKLTDLVAHKKDKEVEYLNQKTKQVVFKDTGSHIEAKNTISKNEAAMMLEYAQKKYGGSLRLSGSEAFKETLALAAAEKGMNIILTPEKYHEMMLKEVERLKETQQQNTNTPKEQENNTIKQNSDALAKPEKALTVETPQENLTERASTTPDPKNDNSLADMASKDIQAYEQHKITSYEVMFKSQYSPEYATALKSLNVNPDTMKDIELMGKHGHLPEQARIDIENKVKSMDFAVSKSDLETMAAQDLKAIQNNKVSAYEIQLKVESNPEYAQALSKVAPNDQFMKEIETMAKYSPMPEAAKQSIEAKLKEQGFDIQVKSEQQKQSTPTIDGKEFNKLIVVPVNKNDGFESHTEFKVAFKHDDKMVTQLKDITESDLNRMGVDTKNIDMRKVEPVSININKLANAQVESPLKHAEKQLHTHIDHMKSKSWSRSEFNELKEQRGKLEANVDKAKTQHAPEQAQQNDQKKAQEQSKGQSM
ncbi:relaxase (plasmid) [Proteus vulgaris]|uniref:LPD7 domain-containing protein n=1 Tax=Proteus vulgaris TaxID=585 RepID=UPI0025421A25|nr:LPD7 domain-containing protein [Proteus vulgaris]WIF74510.1 relaxase [Proteus vulgaris]